jgi:hypothetical protein
MFCRINRNIALYDYPVVGDAQRWCCCGSMVGRCGNVSEQLDPFPIGDYEMELVPCSAAIAGTWRCVTTLVAALVLLWLDGWPMRICK